MKILHTSDWHLGQNFYGYDRGIEHKAFLDQLLGIVKRERPDALIISGDIFHNYSPSAEAQRLYTESLVSIHKAMPEMLTVVIAGNHDSATRLEVDNELWRLANVQVIGHLRYCSDGTVDFSQHLFKVRDKGYIMAIPYIFEQAYPVDPEGKDYRRYFFSLLDSFMQKQNADNLPTVLMAHLAVQNSDLRGQRLKGLTDNIGGIDFMPLEFFGNAFDYVALGHIHHPQTLPGSHGKVRYSGSPIPVSFDEDYPHSVSIVNIVHGREPEIKEIAIDNPCPLLTIPKEPQRTPLALNALQTEVPAEGRCYVRLNPMERHTFPATMEEDAITILKGLNSEAMYTTFIPNITKAKTASAAKADFTPEQLVTMQPIDVARQYFDMLEEDFGEYEELFKQVIRRIEEEEAK